MRSLVCFVFLLVILAPTGSCSQPKPGYIDLTNAVVASCARPNTPEAKAVQMLVEEVEKRSRIRWPIIQPPLKVKSFAPQIVVGLSSINREIRNSPNDSWNVPEGYSISSRTGPLAERVMVLGGDSRGILYGVGTLLRNLRMERDNITIPANLNIASKPYNKLRGHQLGYRPKTNSYDAWTVPMWEQYIRDLIVFGANSVELVPPRTDDDADSPHFPLPPMQMMIEMDKLLDSYGMDVWIWYPAMDKDYTDPKTVQASLKEWGDVFRKLKRVDAVFVPGGDPGHTEPKVLMALLEKQAANLRKYHPKAQMWVSPQGFSQAWVDQFIGILKNQRPKWLSGVVFGPQVRTPLPELRKLVPAQYPIRHYPDITHTMQCQFPVENWDVAFALTEGREPINPRPIAEAHICRWHQPYTIGSITYSEGCNDDVNKAIWSALEWDPKTDVKQILREYSRYFISSRFEEKFAEGLLALEKNWEGPVEANTSIDDTFKRFRDQINDASPQVKLNWRFQQALYRANYDIYVKYKHEYDAMWEQQCLKALKLASQGKEDRQIVSLRSSVMNAVARRPALLQTFRQRVFELADALFNSIRMQLSVPRYDAIAVWRGANLDSIDTPITNLDMFCQVLDEPAYERGIRVLSIPGLVLIQRTVIGPGDLHVVLGRSESNKFIIDGSGFRDDPGSMHSARIGFEEDFKGPIEWARFAETLYDTPLRMRFPVPEPGAAYKLRVVYGPDKPEIKLR